MKRSRTVRLTLVATASSAAAVGGAVACRTPAQDAMRCVERGTNRVVPDSLCGSPQRLAADSGGAGSFGNGSARAGYGGGYYGGPHISPFLWYYGGRVAGGYASAGGYSPLTDRYYRSSSGVSFGSGARRGFFGGGRSGGSSGGSSGGGASHGTVSRGGFGGIGAGHGAPGS